MTHKSDKEKFDDDFDKFEKTLKLFFKVLTAFAIVVIFAIMYGVGYLVVQAINHM